MKMKTTEDGLNGARSEIVPFREELAKEPDIEIVIHPKHLKEDYHVLDPIQKQKIASLINVWVGTVGNVEKTLLNYRFSVTFTCYMSYSLWL